MSASWIAFCIIMSYILLLCFIVYIGINLKTNKVMKELSNEDKAKRYDEALHKAKRIINVCVDDNTECRSMIACIQQIFPELKESEDERILKQLRDFFKNHINSVYEEIDDNNDVLAWLEKQGNPTEDELEALRMAAYEPTKNWSEKLQSLYEKLTHCEQKPVFEMKTPEESLGIDSNTYNKIVDECIFGEQKHTDKSEPTDYNSIDPHFAKPIDKVEPKFKVGDWVTNGDYTCKIVEAKPLDYILQSQDGNIIDDTISYVDEQFHSVTIQDAKDGDVLVTREKKQPFIFKKYDEDTDYVYAYCGICDLVKDNSFHIDDDQLWTCYSVSGDVYPATKEQRDQLEKAMADAGYTFDFKKKELKKIEQKLAWSEEDERIYMSIMYSFAHNYPLTIQQQEFVKSLKDKVQPQNTWKPSDEQTRILDLAIRCGINRGTTEENTLVSLFNDLKKLKA